MNRTDLIRHLIRVATYQISNRNVVVILKNYERIRAFSKEFQIELSHIPEWIRPKPVSLNIRRIEFPHLTISIVYGGMGLRGLNISHAFMANDLDVNDEHELLLCLLPSMPPKADIPEKFDDV